MAKLKAAVIGCGAIAHHCHLLGYQANTNCELVAAAEPSKVRRTLAEEKFGVLRTYRSAETMFKKEELDVVSVCSPNAYHAEQAIMALEHGCHVICEKPLCLSMAEARKIRSARDKAGTLFMTAFSNRFYRGTAKAKRILLKGDIGEPFMIRIRFAHGGPQPGWAMSDWFYNPTKAGGGAMLDMGIHAIDLASYYMGRIRSVSASIGTLVKNIKVDDNAVLVLEFQGKRLGYIEAGWTSRPGFIGVEIYGTEGTIISDYVRGMSVLRGRTMPDGTVKTSWRTIDKIPTTGGWDVEVDEFVKCIKKGIQPESDLEAGIAAVEVALAAYKSAESGKRINV